MTIVKDSSAPLLVVVGATGNQGGSVVKNAAASSTAYRVRGLTRDAKKATAVSELGGEAYSITIKPDGTEEAKLAFAGASFIFIMTDYWRDCDGAREVAEGKMLLDAAKAVGPKRVVWSGLPSHKAATNGKLSNIHHFESKALVTAYGRTLGVNLVDVQAGFYHSNLASPTTGALPNGDGTYSLRWTGTGASKQPMIDIPKDYGKFVMVAFEDPRFEHGGEVRTVSQVVKQDDIAAAISKHTGKTVSFKALSLGEFMDRDVIRQLPAHVQDDFHDMAILAQDGLEFYGGKQTPSLDLVQDRQTLEQMIGSLDWSHLT